MNQALEWDCIKILRETKYVTKFYSVKIKVAARGLFLWKMLALDNRVLNKFLDWLFN